MQDSGYELRNLGGPILACWAGERIDTYLAKNFPFASRHGWQDRLRNAIVRVDRRPVKISYKLKEGEQIALLHQPESEPPVNTNIWQLWRSGPIMAVYKPNNLPMHENGPYRTNTFASLIRSRFGDSWAAVHRLDFETSGIVICAETESVRRSLHELWVRCQVKKEYLAIVDGIPRQTEWTVDAPIGDLEESAIRIKKWVVPNGLPSQTHFRTLATGENNTALLLAQPRTGRTNQIRIHAAYSGHHLLGDKLYHPDESVFLEYWDKGVTDQVIEQTRFRRLCLHAYSLRFQHPKTGQTISIQCPLPDDMQELLTRYRMTTESPCA